MKSLALFDVLVGGAGGTALRGLVLVMGGSLRS
ncbi:hypothetical protein EDD29_4705 [Actinocorallia herbida]|uniref:Uncharacterized protein n=1 Tax=Actinocorallia herbida TaxID=58109 RepID=A0A3N1D0R5_9ACTN|nr:hypothetical protein EDD29_4705 [Actinocorallia herbida]